MIEHFIHILLVLIAVAIMIITLLGSRSNDTPFLDMFCSLFGSDDRPSTTNTITTISSIPNTYYDYQGRLCSSRNTYYDYKGYLRYPGDMYYDSRERLCSADDWYYDSKDMFREPGENYYDYKGIYRSSNEKYYDCKGIYCEPKWCILENTLNKKVLQLVLQYFFYLN